MSKILGKEIVESGKGNGISRVWVKYLRTTGNLCFKYACEDSFSCKTFRYSFDEVEFIVENSPFKESWGYSRSFIYGNREKFLKSGKEVAKIECVDFEKYLEYLILCEIQWLFKLNRTVLTETKRNEHRYRLGKTDSPYVELERRKM